MTTPDWSKLTIPLEEVNPKRLLAVWAWLLDRRVRALTLTRFGDWFLEDEKHAVHRLDLLEGTFSPVCKTVGEYEARRVRDEELANWFQDGMVYAMYRSGQVPGGGRGFGYRLPPVLGGSVTRENIVIVTMDSWQPFMSQIHEQLRRLPPGARVGAVHVNPDGSVRLDVVPGS